MCRAIALVLALSVAALASAEPADCPVEAVGSLAGLASELPEALPQAGDDGDQEAEELNVMLLQTQVRLDHSAALSARKAGEEVVHSGAALAEVVANLSANLDEALNHTLGLLEAAVDDADGQAQAAPLTAEAAGASVHGAGQRGGGSSWAKDPDDPAYIMEVPGWADAPNTTSNAQPAWESRNASGDESISMLSGRTKAARLHATKSHIGERHKDSDEGGVMIVIGLTAAVTVCVCVCASDSPLRRALEPTVEKAGQSAAAMGPVAPAASAAAQGVAESLST